ncbi:glycosyltransferase [candidate division KSB1 bacterium]|nr:glycosyltransferase [candidate division KSB1 bacterium]
MNILFPYMARWKAINWSRYHQILTKLAQIGHNVHVFQPPSQKSSETNYQEIEIDVPENFYLHEVPLNARLWHTQFPLNKLVKKGYYSLAVVPLIREFIRHQKIDVMLLYNIPQYPLLKVSECAIMFDFADDYIEMLAHEIGNLKKLQVLRIGNYLLKKMFARADMNLAVSNVLLDLIPANGRLLPNGVDLNEFQPGSGARIAQNYPKPIVGFIGSFEYFIDFDLILTAAARLPQITFLLVGSGREMPRIQERIARDRLANIHLTGGVPHSQIGQYIDAMDICLNIFKKIPVSHRACPIKLFEYLVLKKPVISTRLEEVEKIDEHYLWYADTVAELVTTIEKILAGSAQTATLIDNGFRAVQTKYNWDVIARDFICMAEEIRRQQPRDA